MCSSDLVFYKHFRNPIETAILDAGSGSYTYTFENADRSRSTKKPELKKSTI